MNFKDTIKAALAGKNKQAHRVSGGSKAGRRLLAQHKNSKDIIQRDNNEPRSLAEADFRECKARTNSKTDFR